VEIAKRHIVPKQLEENGLTPDNLVFTDASLRGMVTSYTREAGLRNLEREVAAVSRKVARKVAEGLAAPVKLSPKNLHKFLGAPKVLPDEILQKDEVGIATGLAWTATGGDVLFIEATAMRGKGRLTLTGQLGEVMKESAQAALSYARSRARVYGIRDDFFSSHDIHVHIPEGAIPKDGPSAGITMATAMLSVFTNRPVRRSLAMTGEITLRGNVLPIGGLKEKILAARRLGIDTLICPKLNQKELDEVPTTLKRGLSFHLVEHVDQVLKLALIPPLEPRDAIGSGSGPKPSPKAFPARPRIKPVTV
jgi:ATP-dependent Lon protease